MKSHKINQQVQHINKLGLQKTMTGSCNGDLNILFVVLHDDLFRLLLVVFLSLFLFCTCSEAPMKSSTCLGSNKAECVGVCFTYNLCGLFKFSFLFLFSLRNESSFNDLPD